MKSHTDLEQSKKLAEILSIDSSDMSWVSNGLGKPFARTIPIKGNPEELCACWSLAALLNVMPSEVVDNHFLTLHKEGEEYCCCYENYNGHSIKGCFSDNPIDACYEMIIKLKERNLI